jgi:hypothetical protein
MRPRTREEFIDHCLRRLGAPVIKIEIDPFQLDDRVDDAIDFYNEYHFDGCERVYIKHILTEDDITAGTIVVDEQVLTVIKAYAPSLSYPRFGGELSTGYQLVVNNLPQLGTLNFDYYVYQQSMAEIRNMFQTMPTIEFNRHLNKVGFPTGFPKETVNVGDVIVLECWMALNPEVATDMWGDRMFQQYTALLFKKQWGSNLSKYNGVSILGGVKWSGQEIYQQATAELDKFEQEFADKFSLPIDFMVG